MKFTEAIITLALLIGFSSGCDDEADYDLPAGWEGAAHVEVFQGPEGEDCGPDEQLTEIVAVGLHQGTARLVYEHGVVNCAEDHEAFVR
jgi:hypothetical protein